MTGLLAPLDVRGRGLVQALLGRRRQSRGEDGVAVGAVAVVQFDYEMFAPPPQHNSAMSRQGGGL